MLYYFYHKNGSISCSVVDPDSLNPDQDKNPDPAFQVNPDPDTPYDDEKQRKNTAKQFLIKICNLLITRSPLRTSNLQEKLSALKKNIVHFKT